MNNCLNKLFAAVLIGVILVLLTGFIARSLVHVPHVEKFGYPIEVAESAGATTAAAVEATAEPVLALLATADAAKGEQTAKVCASCHSFDKGGPNRVGPNLYGIIGSNHAHKGDFAYSDGLKALNGKPWTYAALNEFLWNPKKAVAGTKMGYAGMKKPEDRANVIAYLRSKADAPAALPSEADIAAEAPKPEEAAPAAEETATEPVKAVEEKAAETKQ